MEGELSAVPGRVVDNPVGSVDNAAPLTLLGSAADLCVVCRRTRLRADNRTGICGYCQANGVPSPALQAPVPGPLVPELAPRSLARGGGGRLSITIARKRLRQHVLLERPWFNLNDLANVTRWRPKRRVDCAKGLRPCPFVGCRFHLFLEVTDAGSVQFNHPGVELEELVDTCALDVADRSPGDGVTLEAVAELLNLTRERVRQIEELGLVALRGRVQDPR
jgi:hypothetical protein